MRVCVWYQMEETIHRPLSTMSSSNFHKTTLSNLRSSITKRIHFRRSVRDSDLTAGVLPLPDTSAAGASSSHNDIDDSSRQRDHYVSVERQTSAISLDSNSADEIAARYADHPVSRTPLLCDDSTRSDSSSFDSGDVTLPVTTAPSQPQASRPVTSISTSGSVAAGTDIEYLAVAVDCQQSVPVSV